MLRDNGLSQPEKHPYHPWPRPVVIVPPRPYIIAANVAPAACIRLVNPIENRAALRYSVNGGVVRVLPAGSSVCFDQEVVIRFDRGGGQGVARYVLQDGSYRFAPGNGFWCLTHDDDAVASDAPTDDVAANPAPGA